MEFELFYETLLYVGMAATLSAVFFSKRTLDKLAMTGVTAIVASFAVPMVLRHIVPYWEAVKMAFTNGYEKASEFFAIQVWWEGDSRVNYRIILATICLTAVLVKWILNRLDLSQPRTKRFVLPDNCFQAEKMVQGSEFEQSALAPQFQCEVHCSADGKQFFPAGQAFWVTEGLITAAHVISEADYTILRRNDAEVEILKDDWEFCDGDIAILRDLNPRVVQKLGLSKAKLSPHALNMNAGLMVQVVAFGKKTFAFLNPHDQFGYCEYKGSTVRGFSGAPYYMNKTVYGMHLGGSVVNLGYEAAYVKAILRPGKLIKEGSRVRYEGESSEEWLIEQAQAHADEMTYRINPSDVDEYIVKFGRQYHFLPRETFEKMMRPPPRRGVTLDFESLPLGRVPMVDELPLAPRNAMSFQDSGNLIRAPAVDVGARGEEQAQAAVQNSSLQRSTPTDYVSQRPLERSPMIDPESMRAPQNAPSASTLKNRRQKQRLREAARVGKQLSQHYATMAPGQPISQQPTTLTGGSRPSLPMHCESLITTAPQGTANYQLSEQQMARSWAGTACGTIPKGSVS